MNTTKKSGARHAWMALSSMCLMYIIWSGVGWNTLSLYANSIIQEWGVASSRFMLTITLVSFCNAAVSLLFYGSIQEKLGVRKMLLVGGALSTLGFLVFALAQDLAMLYIAGVLFGVGISLLNANTNILAISAWFKKRTSTMISIPQTCSQVSGVVFATVFAALIAALGWRKPMWITFGVSLAATAACYFLYKGEPAALHEEPLYADETDAQSTQDPAAEEDGLTRREMLRRPQFFLMAAEYLLVGILAYAVFSNLALFATNSGFGDYAGTLVSVALLTSGAAMLLGGMIVDKLGSKWMVAICMLCLAAAAFILRSDTLSLPLLYAASALLGIGYDAAILPPGISVREAFGSREYGKKVGILVGVCCGGVSLGPTLMAALYDLNGSYTSALTIVMVIAVCACVLIFPAVRKAS